MSVDLLLTEVEPTWGLGRSSLGSVDPGMTLGVSMPVRWSEAHGLELSLDNIVVTCPQLDAPALISCVFERFAA